MSLTENIITQQVLNEHTGNLESQEYKQVKKYVKKQRGGFTMSYKAYDDAIYEVLRSQLDYKIITYIVNKFTYKQTEITLPKDDLANELETSAPTISRLIAKMIKANILLRVSRGIYRLNPFMTIPYRGNGIELQNEWNTLVN